MKSGTPNELIVWLCNQPQDKRYEVKEKKERRTLTQNAYYWTLITKVADKMRMSKTELHNLMMRDYGREWEVDGGGVAVWRPNSDAVDRAMLRNETLHFKPTDKTTIRDNVIYRLWVLLKPSHEMTTEEMSVLVDGLVQEAQALDIETLTWRELQEMRANEIQKQKSKGN